MFPELQQVAFSFALNQGFLKMMLKRPQGVDRYCMLVSSCGVWAVGTLECALGLQGGLPTHGFLFFGGTRIETRV